MTEPNPHPTLWIKEQKSSSLSGKTIVLAVTGSIAAVRTIELARELIRNGADVYAVTTEAAEWIINPYALHYATGNEVITKLTGKVEHVEFCGLKGRADLFLIAPATANTISKIANGIDDTTVTTFATTALGSKMPIMIVPAMHEAMYNHPAVMNNIETLVSWGIRFTDPKLEEGIAKIASNEQIVLDVERVLGEGGLAGKRVIITSGSTAESIDPIRILTNRASGKTGIELAMEAYRRGADVTIVHRSRLGFPRIKEIFAESAQQMTDAVLSELETGYDALISAAAIADYTMDARDSKIKSGGEMKLELRPTRKLIAEARQAHPELVMVGFKAEAGASREELMKSALETLEKTDLDMIAANEVSKGGMGTDENDIFMLGKGKYVPVHVSGSKRSIASALLDELGKRLKAKGVD